MKNLVLFVKNINNYGVITFFKIIFFEILFTIKNFDFKSLKYEPFQNDEYELTKKNKIYNTPYIPTPYYFLKIIKSFFLKKKIKKIILIDIGCGYSRSQKFFRNLSNFFLGFDYNLKIINYLKNQKLKKTRFYCINFRERESVEFLITKISKIRKNHEIVLFFSDSFDLFLLKNIISKLNKEFKFYCVLVNLKNKFFYKKKAKYLYKKVFKDKKKNIYITKF